MESNKIAPLVVYLASDRAAHVSGQIFGVRANEIYFYNQIRMQRSLQNAEGWTPESIADEVMPTFAASLTPNTAQPSVMPWDPI